MDEMLGLWPAGHIFVGSLESKYEFLICKLGAKYEFQVASWGGGEGY